MFFDLEACQLTISHEISLESVHGNQMGIERLCDKNNKVKEI